MPLPVIHSAAGYTIYRFSKEEEQRESWKIALFVIFLANLPDIDFLPGIMIHQATRFHHGVTHSLGATVICSVILGFLARLFKKGSFLGVASLSFAAYFSHVMLDYLNGHGCGVPLFWPFSATRYGASFSISLTRDLLAKNAGLGDFLAMFTTPPFVKGFLFEASLVLFFWLAVKIASRLVRKLVPQEAAVQVSVAIAFVLFVIFAVVRG